MKKYIFLLFILLVFLGCKKNEDEIDIIEIVTYHEPIVVDLVSTDTEILEKVYNDTYLYPADYSYKNDVENASIYYENTISIRTNENSWIELHTKDKKQVKDWSERSSRLGSQYRPLVQERETEKYFEFERKDPSKYVYLSRVHKSSYFIPTIDRLAKPNPNSLSKLELGIFTQRPITIASTKLFIDYLNSCQSTIFGNKILETKVVELPNWFQYNLKSSYLSGSDIGLHDRIEVWESDFFMHKRTGKVYTVSKKIKELIGKKR